MMLDTTNTTPTPGRVQETLPSIEPHTHDHQPTNQNLPQPEQTTPHYTTTFAAKQTATTNQQTPNQPSNLRQNIPLVQSRLLVDQYWGDPLPTTRRNNSFRIYFQNVNGLQCRKPYENLKTKLSHLRNLQPDYFGLVEPNLDSTKYQVRNIIHKHLSLLFENTVADRLTSSSIQSLHSYKPGGVLSALTGKWSHDGYQQPTTHRTWADGIYLSLEVNLTKL